MNFINRISGVLAVVALITSAIVLYSVSNLPTKIVEVRDSALGAVTGETNLNTLGVTGLKIGSSCGDSFTSTAANGCDTVSHLMFSTCSMLANNSISATTTGYAYCTGLTGVTSSDSIIASFATSTLGQNFRAEGFHIISAKASSTAGIVDFILYNNTGRDTAPSAAGRIASTTNLLIIQ